MKIEALKQYEIVERKMIEGIDSEGIILRHVKTGARIALLKNDDENKVFSIAFRTPPKDSTGVAHIVEHTVLCGSEKYPIKDPFVELCKGSLNTFLNAMTFPDKTVYPVASCNDKDFRNLCSVYLDAVFFPNIHKEEKIFRQEGWHYELSTPEDELKINGVVYSEMKGAFSNPDEVFEREIMNSLYPDTTYGVESGGDPDVIPTLTYEDFCAFHKRYYHPSNSYIYLYGDMDMAEVLEWMDAEYLSKFDYLQVDSVIKRQECFSAPIEKLIEYPITDNEDDKAKTNLSLNFVIDDKMDETLYLALNALSYCVCESPASPLRKELLARGIGNDVYSFCDTGIMQPYFSIIAKETEACRKDEFITTIKSVLRKMVEDKIDKKTLLACISGNEFKYREADYGRYPKGLMYNITMLESWLYSDESPFRYIDAFDTFKRLKELIDTDYYEKLIEKYLLNNNHCSVVVAVPKKGLANENDRILKERLADYKSKLTKEEIDKIIEDTRALKEYQETPDSEENLQKIPLLELKDISRDKKNIPCKVDKLGDITVLKHEIPSNKIAYFLFAFDCNNIPFELLKYGGLLVALLGKLDTTNYSYGELFDETTMYTGGIGFGFDSINTKEDKMDMRFIADISAMYEFAPKAINLAGEVLFNTLFEDKARIHEVVLETISQLQSRFMSAGNAVAAARVRSYYSKSEYILQYIKGIEAYRMLKELDNNYDKLIDTYIDKIKQLLIAILRPENIMFDVVAKDADFDSTLLDFTGKLHTADCIKEKLDCMPVVKNEAFITSGKVQFVCRGGNFKYDIYSDSYSGYTYNGSYKVLKVMMGYDYLWNNIRVKGGAYGCMSGYAQSGMTMFVSYRDPNLLNTVKVFESIPEYLKSFECDSRNITQYIIGAIADEDAPLTPRMKADVAFTRYRAHLTIDDINKKRHELLDTDCEAIRKIAPAIEQALKSGYICVVGAENEINANKSLFKEIHNLFE